MTGQLPVAAPKLLIIEDDMGLCGQYRWAFPSYEVLFAHDRSQALALAGSAHPAVAIMDLGLPPDPDRSQPPADACSARPHPGPSSR